MLIINQGIQDVKDDNKFDVIVEKNVFGKITEVKLHETFENTLSIQIDIIDNAKYNGRKVWDTVTFDPKSEYSWKYRSLRKCIGKPYTANEDPKVDIEKLLVGKKVKMNLDVRQGSDGNEYQKITFIAKKTQDTEPIEVETATVDEDTTIDDTDLPW